jgi:hypothetical protein
MTDSLLPLIRRTVGVLLGVNFGVMIAYVEGLGLPVTMRICAWAFFVPLGAIAGFCIAEAAA